MGRRTGRVVVYVLASVVDAARRPTQTARKERILNIFGERVSVSSAIGTLGS
jgi:hypothetical protein